MARFEARTFTKAELNKALGEIMKRNTELLGMVSSPGVFRAAFNAGLAIQARAQEIIEEKGHVDTGTLVRSINTQVFRPGDYLNTAGDESSCQRKLARVRGSGPAGRPDNTAIVVEVGSFVEYAPCIEALPDGGFLFQASEEAFGMATEIIASQGIDPELVRWASGSA